MKKIIFTLFTIIVAYSGIAQITINRTDFGNIGNTYYFATDTTLSGVNIGAKGLNATWDFSSILKADRYDSTEYVDPINLPGYPEGCNLATISNGGEPTFVSLTNSEFKIYIPEGEIPFPLSKNTLSLYKFPLDYLNSSQDEINVDIKNTPEFFGIPGLPSFIDSIRIVLEIKSLSLVDAAGSLKTPIQTYASVLRVRNVNNTKTTVYFRNSLTSSWTISPQGNENTSDTAYSFLGTNSGSEIMSILTDSLGKPNQIRYRIPSFNPTNLKEISVINSIQVYPNPASEIFTISLQSNSNLNASFSLTDVSGKQVKNIPDSKLNAGFNQLKITTDGLENGIYFLNIQGDGLKTVKKIIINK
jgi:hypothetical protein